MDTDTKTKSTIRYGTEMINLRIPLALLPHLNDHAKRLGISRSKLLLTGALFLIESELPEGQPMPTIK